MCETVAKLLIASLLPTKAAIAHIKACGLGEDAVQRLLSKTEDEGKKLKGDKYDWIEGDESVPEGIFYCWYLS